MADVVTAKEHLWLWSLCPVLVLATPLCFLYLPGLAHMFFVLPFSDDFDSFTNYTLAEGIFVFVSVTAPYLVWAVFLKAEKKALNLESPLSFSAFLLRVHFLQIGLIEVTYLCFSQALAMGNDRGSIIDSLVLNLSDRVNDGPWLSPLAVFLLIWGLAWTILSYFLLLWITDKEASAGKFPGSTPFSQTTSSE